MTWNTSALARDALDATTDNVASGLSQLHTALGRVNEMLLHPASAATTAWPLTSQSLVQIVTQTITTNINIPGSTAANIIPLDDSIPQSTEGYSLLNQAFTPKSATSTIVISLDGFAVCGGTALYDSAALALFAGSANAIHAQWLAYAHTASIDHVVPIRMVKVVTSGSTSLRTYNVRLGPTTATGNVAINGTSGGRVFGGVAGIVLTVSEYV